MKNRLWITLTDVTGARQFGIKKSTITRLILLIVLSLLALVLYPVWLNDLNQQWQDKHLDLVTKNQQLQQLNHSLITSESSLKQRLKQKTFDYDLSTQQYNLLVGQLNFQDDHLLNSSDRFNELSYEISFRQMVLQLIPNGRPTDYDRVTSSFGNRMHPFKKIDYVHKGIDLHAYRGTPVVATADGIVTSLQNTKDGFGKLIKVSHAFGFKTYYGHLKTIGVDWYQVVQKGDIIGYSGNSGRSTGPHLHYEVRFGAKALDPADFILWNINSFEKQIDKIEEIPWASLMVSLHNLAVARPQPLSPKIAASTENSILTVACTSTDGCLETSNVPRPSPSASPARSMAK